MKSNHSQTRALAEHTDASNKCNHLINLLLLLLISVWTPTWADAVLPGHVVAVHGGDALTLIDAQQREHRLRLAFIETPELAQPFGEEAQTALAALVLNRDVKAQILEKADDGAQQAEVVSPSGRNVNLELLRRGLAWHNYFDRQPAAERERYRAALLEAQRDRRGMWALDRLETPRDLGERRQQLLRWWLYAIAVCAAFALIGGVFAINERRIDAWLARQDAQSEAGVEKHRQAHIATEAAAAERDRIRAIANLEMDRLAAERRQRLQSAREPSPPNQPGQE